MNKKYCDCFAGKKITIMGLGLLGRGVGDALFLAECGARLTITDTKTKEELASSLAKLKPYKNIAYTLGGHRMEDFQNVDMVLKAAGVPLDSPYIAEAQKNNIPVEMSTALFAKFTSATVVGVTGTRGKSTVTHLLHSILSESGLRVHLGGNVRGISTLALLPNARAGDIVVLELDSWQLQGFGDLRISPHLAVFATFMFDHMNYYHGDMDTYLADKANIFLFQEPGDTLVVGAQAAPILKEKYVKSVQSTIVVAKPSDVPQDFSMLVPGEHFRYNVAVALAAARVLGVSDENIKKSVASFVGLPGRLERIGEYDGVVYYNDTTATTPDATIAALRALGGEKRKKIILIAGGSGKGLDPAPLIEEIERYGKALILLPGSGTEKLTLNLKPKTYNLILVPDLANAVEEAVKQANRGDTILFSPAFASFGLFKNEFDRGGQFKKAVGEFSKNKNPASGRGEAK